MGRYRARDNFILGRDGINEAALNPSLSHILHYNLRKNV